MPVGFSVLSWGRRNVSSSPCESTAPCAPNEQLAHLSCRGGDRFRWVQRRVAPLSLTTTVLLEHLVTFQQTGGMEHYLFTEHFPVAEGVP